VRLTVEDNGPGIAPEFLPHVFERFRQADTSNRRPHQGLGLGLAIVRQLVEIHGGTVRVDNREEGTGAIFTVDLPRRSVGQVLTPGATPDRHPLVDLGTLPGVEVSLDGVRVLVVDDHQDALDLLQVVLERCGAVVDTASSAAAALAKVPLGRPDVILSDIEMPGESGYDLLRQLRALPAHQGGLTPVAALTAYATPNDRVLALRAGFAMHVPKPVLPAELAAVVASLARRTGPAS
jgi:CheY-like chemotaxis protein